jgi:hypothetical protein
VFGDGDGCFLDRNSTHEIALGAYVIADDFQVIGKIFPNYDICDSRGSIDAA